MGLRSGPVAAAKFPDYKIAVLRHFSLLGILLVLCLCGAAASAQPEAWFVDGYHGGIYGHYPATFTQFMVDSMRANPEWKLNLEIEPETWDFARTNTPEAYSAFKVLAADQSASGRIEFVNPAYGQSYLWTASGESMIQQLVRGMRKIREHFPNAEFRTYSSEEPCFTGALPGILKSFGFKYAVLKNPNTCWGGYTRAFGGELVNWVGPDGTGISTVPRYEIEALRSGSTWETIANANSPEYINAALQAGIQHPVGMCLQDAGWRHGPWLKQARNVYEPTRHTTWRNYFENVAVQEPGRDWHLSQEDIQVSLVWGAQVLQRIAQQVHRAENRLVVAEKMAAIAGTYQHAPWPESQLDDAWRSLLLSQHHDCWIVPYNGRSGNTWADKVSAWTSSAVQQSDWIVQQATSALTRESNTNEPLQVRVFNTMGVARTNVVRVELPESWQGVPVVSDPLGRQVASQVVRLDDNRRELIFSPAVPALGYNTFGVGRVAAANHYNPLASVAKDGCTLIETDLYRIKLDPVKGGTIRSLVTKQLGNREWVDAGGERCFNEVRGFFTDEGRFFSTADHAARIEVLENGPIRARVRITGQVASNEVTQVITVAQGQRRIDCSVRIDWRGNVRVGSDFEQGGAYRREHDRKAFYEDRFKLQALFPVNLKQPKVFKDAPFDVTESRLRDTFFDSWSGIKNNILLNWADVFDAEKQLGMTIITDHTTSYAHGPDDSLGLTLLYSGVGLWGRDYRIHGPTEVTYALVPHAGDWDQAGLCAENNAWNEPFITQFFHSSSKSEATTKSLLAFDQGGWEVPTMRVSDHKLLVRMFNASQQAATRRVTYDGPVSKAELVRLDGELLQEIPTKKDALGRVVFSLTLPPFGVGTLRITP